jgi:chromosome partitioning protein
MSRITDPKAFEVLVSALYNIRGWKVQQARVNQEGYDSIISNGSITAAVQCTVCKKKADLVDKLNKFVSYLEKPLAAKFSDAYLICSNEPSQSTIKLYRQLYSEVRQNLVLGYVADNGELIYLPPENKIQLDKQFFGVFTCKGGVGKTTISAHLAGMLAHSGYNVGLVDCDPQRSLTALVGKELILRSGKGVTNSVTVYPFEPGIYEKLSNEDAINMVVCDCPPLPSRKEDKFDYVKNYSPLFSLFNYCIVPTSLNPLGINKNGDVIDSTCGVIRGFNKKANIFVLINNYFNDETEKSKCILEYFRNYFKLKLDNDLKFKLIDPDVCAIRHSKHLFNWGYHIIDGGNPELAFSMGGRGVNHAREDFIRLISYIEENSDLEDFKSKTKQMAARNALR